jgi:hypothetical protein
MLKSRLLSLGLLATLVAAPAFAQTVTAPAVNPVGSTVATDAAQQTQIQQGLQSGALSTGEAAKLENGEKRIDDAQAHALKTGDTPAEAAHIEQMQTNEAAKINTLDTNAVKGNPASASSQRMQGDVARDAAQENRINNGVQNGTLTNKEAAKAERGQAKVDRREAKAGANGHVNAREQRRIARTQGNQSGKIYRAKHNRRTVPSTTTTPAAQ